MVDARNKNPGTTPAGGGRARGPVDHDLHLHTPLSACCRSPSGQHPREVIARARRMNLRAIAFTDHIWVNRALTPSEWYRPQDESQVSRLRAQLAELEPSIEVLVGCEAETIAPGRFGLTRAFAETVDFVLLACSHIHQKELVAQPRSDDPRDIGAHLLEMFLSAVQSGLPDAIPHPFLPCGRLPLFDRAIASLSDQALLDAFATAAENNVAIEATVVFLPGPDRVFSQETPVRLLSLARRAGCRFTLGSDAHVPERQERLPELAPLVEAAGIGPGDLWLNGPERRRKWNS